MNRISITTNPNYPRWKALLEEYLKTPEEPVLITTLRRKLDSASRPIFARGIDKNEYVIKGKQAGRQIINDQIVGRLGQAMNAPVAEPNIVEIGTDLIESTPGYDYLSPGKAHGAIFIPDCFDTRDVAQYARQDANRSRFALLSVLYGWVYAQDHQFIYQKQVPNLVFSVDHGHFFYGGPGWTMTSLTSAPSSVIDGYLRSKCKITGDELMEALEALQAVDEDTIIRAIASVPTEWKITIDERTVLVEYLLRRQQEILASNLLDKA